MALDRLLLLTAVGPSTGWRDIGITALFVVSSYSLTFVLMKLRTKKTKTAKVSKQADVHGASNSPR